MLKNCVSLVTGGASGLGLGTVKRFARNGSKVIFCDWNTEGAEIASQIGKHVQFIPADVSSESDMKNVVNEIEKKYGKLNFVVNCAGISNSYALHNYTTNKPSNIEDFWNVVEVNLIGTYNVIRQTSKLISKNKPDQNGFRGVYINTAGAEAMKSTQNQSAIAAASSGIVNIAKPLARQFQELGIRVVTISPGMFDTPLNQSIPIHVQKNLVESCSLAPHKLGDPDQFAYMVQTIILNPAINGCNIDMTCGAYFATNDF